MYKQLKIKVVMFDYNDKKYALIIIILFKFYILTIICSFLIDALLECLMICHITKIDHLNRVN